MTITDKFSGRHSSCHPQALRAYERAVESFAAHKPFLGDLEEVLALEPHLPAAHALKGLAGSLMGRAPGMVAARAGLGATLDSLAARDGGTRYERTLTKALAAAAAGRMKRAASHLEDHLRDDPTDLLVLKLSHAFRFMTGQSHEMLETTGAVLPSWSKEVPGYGFALGCRAFALEETGNLRAAEEIGRLAVAHQSDDVWGLHAVAHVMEMGGRTMEGRLWLGAARTQFGTCGSFGQHLVWHLALFHLSEGNREGALALYDAGLKPARNGDFRDMSNAVSLLWRLEQEGVDVGTRWEALHEIAYERRLDCTYAFASLHYLMALIAARDTVGVAQLIEQMRRRSRGDATDQSAVLARIGVPLAEALQAASTSTSGSRSLSELACDVPLLGGSRAQQDVFVRSLMVRAADTGDIASLAAIADTRRARKVEDRFQAAVARRATASRTYVQISA